MNDCNDNDVPDECDIANGTEDCDLDGLPDECLDNWDCNENGVSDLCDIQSGSVDLNGNGLLDECECLHSRYCTAAPNSSSPGGAQVYFSGSLSVSANDLTLTVVGGVPNNPGLFYYGANHASAPFGDGIRCVAFPIFRVPQPIFVNSSGTASLALDYGSPPFNTQPSQVEAGSIFNFQFWYRDPAGANFTYNLSDALQFTFCP